MVESTTTAAIAQKNSSCAFVVVDHSRSRQCRIQAWANAPKDLLTPLGIESFDLRVYCQFHAYQLVQEKQQQAAKEGKIDEKHAEFMIVTCPYEPKNRMPAGLLEVHLLTCPKKADINKTISKDFYTEAINVKNKASALGVQPPSISPSEVKSSKQMQQTGDTEPAAFMQFDEESTLKFIQNIYAALASKFSDQLGAIGALFDVDKQVERIEELLDVNLLTEGMKHGNQQTKIVQLMEQNRLLVPKTLFVEFGAGKAGLIACLSKVLKHQDFSFLMIERGRNRNKLDKDIKERGFRTIRERMDIADFDLVKWLQCQETTGQITYPLNIVGIAKHLCGGATDLALTSFEHLEHQSAELNGRIRLTGLSIATCCHHSCDTHTYVNMQFVQDVMPQLVGSNGQVCAQAFSRFVRCSSWAVAPQVPTVKRAAGFKVKRIIDLGRLLFIKQLMDKNGGGSVAAGEQQQQQTTEVRTVVQAIQYCDSATESPESTLLLASR